MDKFLTISNAPLPYPGTDYRLLREEGLKTIAKLAGDRWTDYNSHDPGITILEALCYAITDLSYRLDFEMADLLAYPDGRPESLPQCLTAREILTVNPLTITDYRKVLIDIPGVKNAWLESIDIPQPELYYNTNKASLSFSRLNLAEPVNLRGLYRILLEKEKDVDDPERLVITATEKFHQQRNLCEDLGEEIRVLPIEKITIEAEIEIGDRFNPNQLIIDLYTALEEEISPTLKFLSLPELMAQGVPVEDIFVGPQLDHGFLDDQQLKQFKRKEELHVSDLIHIILDMDGIETVRRITLSSDLSPNPEPWALDLDRQLTPSLESITDAVKLGHIKFYKGQIECPLDLATIQIAQLELSSQSESMPLSLSTQDIPIPRGEYRELADYETIQSEFPLTYGIGEFGLPASATDERQAQAKQLQAYLMVFDQLLANYFVQLDQVRELFSLSNREIKTYFAQSIEHFPGAQTILKDSYSTYLEGSSVIPSEELNRKNRFLDHLLAQYGEQFTDSSLLYPGAEFPEAIAHHKVDFALEYRQISANRNQAFNYTLDSNKNTTINNVSGLKRRVARLLGIEPKRQFLASSDDTEGFYLVEHLLLRPRPEDRPDAESDSEQAEDFLSFSKAITEFIESSHSGYVTCTCENHGLKEDHQIDIFFSIHYNGTYTVTNIQTDSFDIEHAPLSSETKDSGSWVLTHQYPDPFSFQISVVLPTWPKRFSDLNFRQLVIDMLVAETPAHITLHLHWFDPEQMGLFETTYSRWIEQLEGKTHLDPAETEDPATTLIKLLQLGFGDIQEPPALLGYMTIVEDENDPVENPFKVL